jgi:hypothetical protein
MGKLHTIYDAKLKTGLMRRMDFGSKGLKQGWSLVGGLIRRGLHKK